jgi:acetyltransferase-like isoleucine patch superfamily enzyme
MGAESSESDSFYSLMKYHLKLLFQWIRTIAFRAHQMMRGNIVLARKVVGRVILGRGVYISEYVRIISERGGSIIIGDGSKIGTMSIVEDRGGHIRIGRNTSINSFSVLYGHGGLTIGDNCMFATGLIIIPANHTFSDPDREIRDQGETMQGVTIEDDVWMGARVTVLDGVTIGRGSVIGAGAVVLEHIPPMSVAVGVPARVIKKR